MKCDKVILDKLINYLMLNKWMHHQTNNSLNEKGLKNFKYQKCNEFNASSN